MLKKIFDPNKTIRHISYKELKKNFKREQERSEKFLRTLFVISLAAMFLLAFAQYVTAHW